MRHILEVWRYYNLTSWQCSFHLKLYCYWLRGLQQRQIAVRSSVKPLSSKRKFYFNKLYTMLPQTFARSSRLLQLSHKAGHCRRRSGDEWEGEQREPKGRQDPACGLTPAMFLWSFSNMSLDLGRVRLWRSCLIKYAHILDQLMSQSILAFTGSSFILKPSN